MSDEDTLSDTDSPGSPGSGDDSPATRHWGETRAVSRVPAASLWNQVVREAPDVCANCYRLIREERTGPRRSSRSDVSAELSPYTRRRRTTTVRYAPAERVSEQVGVFCSCGVEGPYDRHRLWEIVTWERYRDLVRQNIRTLEAKGYAVERERFAAVALARAGHAPLGPATVAYALHHATEAAVEMQTDP